MSRLFTHFQRQNPHFHFGNSSFSAGLLRSAFTFEVDDYHTYFVSATRVLVHNANYETTKKPKPTKAELKKKRTKAEQLAINKKKGKEFEEAVLKKYGIEGKKKKIGHSIPDAVDGDTIYEIKNTKYVCRTKQFKEYLKSGKRIVLIVKKDTKIAKKLKQEILANGDIIYE